MFNWLVITLALWTLPHSTAVPAQSRLNELDVEAEEINDLPYTIKSEKAAVTNTVNVQSTKQRSQFTPASSIPRTKTGCGRDMGLILLRMRFSVPLLLYALAAILLSTTEASQLDSRSYRSWMEKKAIVKRVAENNRCSDGRAPAVTEFKMIGDIMVYNLRCEDVGSRNSTTEAIARLDKRQDSLSGYFRLLGNEFQIQSYKSCAYSMQNLAADTRFFCYSAFESRMGSLVTVESKLKVDAVTTHRSMSSESIDYQSRNPLLSKVPACRVYAQEFEASGAPASSTQPSISSSPPDPTPISTSTFESSSSSVLSIDPSGSTSTRTSNSTGIAAAGRSTSSSQITPGLPSGIYSSDQQDNARNTTSIMTSISTTVPTLPGDHKQLNTAMIVGITIGLIATFALIFSALFALRRRRRKRAEYTAAITSQFAPGTPIEDARPWVMLPEMTPFEEKNVIPLVGSSQGIHNTPRRTTLAGAPGAPITPSGLNETRSRLRKKAVPSMGAPQRIRTMPRRNTLAGSTVPIIIVSSPNERRPRSLEQPQLEQEQEQEHEHEQEQEQAQEQDQEQDQEQEQEQGQDQEQYEPAPTLRLHPRSTEALIAAAAPPNMSRDQIDQLTANFVSLVRGRHPQYEDESHEDDESGQEPPPYQGSP
ncbi:hypothetical protein FRC17_007196 [Serendipita sp. 399]|nr:hypothetical protein FRC17_007196 [Serendipita sp. 399]